MNKHLVAYAVLGFVLATQAGVIRKLAADCVKVETKYDELYEMAAYLAGKAEGAGVSLDEEDRLRMIELKPVASA